jgi:hypothetical protein
MKISMKPVCMWFNLAADMVLELFGASVLDKGLLIGYPNLGSVENQKFPFNIKREWKLYN